MIEAARRLQDLEGCPKVEYTSADAFVQKLEAAAPTLPVYDGELYLELHRGTLTAKQQIKKNALSHISEISCNNPGIIFRRSSKIL